MLILSLKMCISRCVGIPSVAIVGFSVEYDTKFGFPKHIYVDPNAQIADEEYGYLTTSVRKLLK